MYETLLEVKKNVISFLKIFEKDKSLRELHEKYINLLKIDFKNLKEKDIKQLETFIEKAEKEIEDLKKVFKTTDSDYPDFIEFQEAIKKIKLKALESVLNKIKNEKEPEL